MIVRYLFEPSAPARDRSLARVLAGVCLLALLATACDGNNYRQAKRMAAFQVTAEDFNDVAETSLKLIDPQGNITMLVVPPGLDSRALAALRRVKPVQPASPELAERLPAGFFAIRSFSIGLKDGEPEASLEGQLGPATNGKTVDDMPDCGKIYTVVYVLTGGNWYSPSYKIVDCKESRHWVPVDEATRQ